MTDNPAGGDREQLFVWVLFFLCGGAFAPLECTWRNLSAKEKFVRVGKVGQLVSSLPVKSTGPPPGPPPPSKEKKKFTVRVQHPISEDAARVVSEVTSTRDVR